MDADLALGHRSSLDRGLDELEREAVARGDAGHLALVARHRSLLALSDGRLTEVESTCELARAAVERSMGSEAAALTRLHHLFRLRLEQGRPGELEKELVTALERYPAHPHLRPMLALVWAQTGRTADARREIAAPAFYDVPNYDVHVDWDDADRLLLLADLCGSVDDPVGADSIYERLRPYAGSFTFPSWGYMHLGPPDHFLGVLSVTAGRWEDADAHFADALALQEAMRARALAAHTLYWRARMLARRRASGDVERAGAILAGVSATTAALGMGGLDRQVTTLLESLEGVTGASTGVLHCGRSVRGEEHDGPGDAM